MPTITNATRKQIEQDGLDLEYCTELNQHIKREELLKQNLIKTYALIMGNYCSKVMENRVEEYPEFKTKIRDNPIELLKAIKVLMHDSARARYP